MLLAALDYLLQAPPAQQEADTAELFPGTGLLFTAPHAVPHARHAAPNDRGERKKHDGATGQMAQVLAANTCAAALVARPRWTGNANADPFELCPFKQSVVELVRGGDIHTVVDLHGMSADHGVDVCIGIGDDEPGEDLERLCKLLDDAGLSWRVNEPFAGRGPGTVRTCARLAGAGAFQLELAPTCRSPRTAPQQTAALLHVLRTLTEV